MAIAFEQVAQSLGRYIPALAWAKTYNRSSLISDITAAVIVTVLLIPQSLAYAMLAGLPPEVGLYASILPLVAYSIFGTSRTLSVGPVAVASLMTATSLGEIAAQGTADYLTGAITLALLSGVFLSLMGLLRMGFVANFLSHAVISGFITASALIIALSQVKHMLGIKAHGDTLPELSEQILHNLEQSNLITLSLGLSVLVFLFLARKQAKNFLLILGIKPSLAGILAKTAPIFGVAATIAWAFWGNLEQSGVALAGAIPSGLPQLSLALPNIELIKSLALPALLISLIGYVESISVGKTLAAKRGQKVDSNQELIGLGAANLASAVSGAFPVTGGFSRSIVNFDAGAVTQAASVFAAVGIGLASLFLTPVLYYLPKATLAATIIVAVLTLVDFSIFKKTWVFAKADFYAVVITVVATLIWGVEVGVSCGVITSLLLYLYNTSRPHIAEVGLVEGSEHFRNVKRYHVQTSPSLLMLRLDENLFFANASVLEEEIAEAVYLRDQIAHVVLMCSAVNEIDYSALEELEEINRKLMDQGIHFHLSEVKGPVMDKLEKTGFIQHISGQVFFTQYEAYKQLA